MKKDAGKHHLSLDEVQQYCLERQDHWWRIVDILEKRITGARDAGDIPTYLTKARVKKPESAFLKIKRKNKSNYKDITDWIGFRVLCLFKQDITPAYDFLVSAFLNRSHIHADVEYVALKEVNVFNWPQEDYIRLKDILLSKINEVDKENTKQIKEDSVEVAYTAPRSNGRSMVVNLLMKHVTKDSGYHSVHFVFDIKLHGMEEVSCEGSFAFRVEKGLAFGGAAHRPG